jgi:hypothetical protein
VPKGRGIAETVYRTVTQRSNAVTYRVLGDALHVGGRCNTVSGRFAGMAHDVSVRGDGVLTRHSAHALRNVDLAR